MTYFPERTIGHRLAKILLAFRFFDVYKYIYANIILFALELELYTLACHLTFKYKNVSGKSLTSIYISVYISIHLYIPLYLSLYLYTHIFVYLYLYLIL